jgi:hypothetical protein
LALDQGTKELASARPDPTPIIIFSCRSTPTGRTEPVDPDLLPRAAAGGARAVAQRPDRLTTSKLGVHVVQNNDAYIMEFIRRARPRVSKSVGDLGWLSDVKWSRPTRSPSAASPSRARLVFTMTPEDARMLIASQIDRYRLNPGADYWEGWNEFVPVDDNRRPVHPLRSARACALQALGFRAAVGGFSVGVPEYAQMAVFLPALEAAYRCGGIFHLHEYNSPTLSCGVTTNQTGAIPGAPNFGNIPVGYHTLRYRFWYEGYLKPRGLGSLPLVISGVEPARPRRPGLEEHGSGGCRGFGPTDPEAYVNLLAWYDSELRKDRMCWARPCLRRRSETAPDRLEAVGLP